MSTRSQRTTYVHLFDGIGLLANAADSTEHAVAEVIRLMGKQLDWAICHVFLSDTNGVLTPASIWHLDDPEQFEQFRITTMSLPDAGKAQLPAMVLEQGKTVWVDDIATFEPGPWSNAAAEAGLRSAFAVPATIDGKTWAILEFFSTSTEGYDQDLVLVVEQIAVQLGLMEARFRAVNALQQANADLLRSNRELEEFASIASHDLQEPLRKIQAFGDRLEKKYGDLLPDEGQDYLHRMRGDAARMQALINDLLAYSRIAATNRPFRDIDLNEIVTNVLSDLEPRVQHTEAQVTVGNLPVIRGDAAQMYQLFQNLVGNALKFQNEDLPPVVQIAAEPVPDSGDPRHWRIIVQDNGIGFNPRHAERIFRMFERLHGRGQYTGTGIGLAICRKIVERHSGTIDADSTPGEGARFTVVLPALLAMKGPHPNV